MRSSTNRLIGILLGTIMLPILVYFIYGLSSVKEEEAVLERVYQNQLDAVLFSVNQFSDNIMNGTMDKLEKRLNNELSVTGQDKTFLEFSTISAIFFQKNQTDTTSFYSLDPTLSLELCEQTLRGVMEADSSLVSQLVNYKKSGYRKIQPADVVEIEGRKFQVIFAVLDGSDQTSRISTALLVDPILFVNDVLGPKLQQMASTDLVITVGSIENPMEIYTTDSINGDANLAKTMWLFPQLQIGVSPKGTSVSQIINDRTQANLFAAGMLIVLLLIGFLLVIRNLRREMLLAQTKSDFVSNVSHELRTPLSLISMFGETLLLERYKTLEKRKEYETIIVKESARLSNIVNKILNFSQIEANKRTYSFAEIDLNELVNELIHDYSYHLESRGFTFDVRLTTELKPILADREAVYEALVNLIDNGMKYSIDRKHLEIETLLNGDQGIVSVKDHGIGIEKNQIPQIFDKFFRVTHGDIQTTRGAGLGLSLVKHIMDAHGGTIQVESELNKGSTFSLVFKLNRSRNA